MSNIEVDPRNSGEYVRADLALEAVANAACFPAITHPRWVLSQLLANPTMINSATITLTRLVGGAVLGCLVAPLVMAYPNTAEGINSRRTVYAMLAGGEIAFIPVLLADAFSAKPAFSFKAGIIGAGMLLPPLLWRGYTFLHPEMFGKYKVKRE